MLSYNFTLVNLTAALSTGVHVATMSSLAQLRVWDTKEQRQGRHDARLTKSGKHQKQAATHDAYRAAKRLRMIARRVLEWIGMLKGRCWYQLSDLFPIC